MTDLPAGWEWARLDEVAEVRLGRQRSPKNHTGNQMRPYLRAANVGWDGLRLDDVKMMNFTDDEVKTYRLEYGDVVVSEASGSPGEVGKPALWRGEIEGCCLQNTLIRVRSFGAVEPAYLLYFLRAEALRGAFAERSRGVGIHHLGSGRLAEWIIPVPPLAEQRRVILTLEEHLSTIDLGLATIRSAELGANRLRSALLEDAFSGGLLPQDPNDEAASALLERVKMERVARPRLSRARHTTKNGDPEQESNL
ncbi:MAG: restriction endonuclease subunit S [Pseudonocardiaceae bacterium]